MDRDSAGRTAPPAETAAPQPAPIPSRRLLGQSRRLLIEHDGEVYVLQITKQNKLLLTK